MTKTLKSGDCYVARLTNGESPVRLVEKTENGHWKTRSLLHGRVVMVKSEAQFLRPCSENDLLTTAVTIQPNRRSKQERIFAPTPAVASRDAASRRSQPKPTQPTPFRMTMLEAAWKILKDAKTALTCKEIVERAEKRKYHRSNGDTPHYSLHTAMTREIQSKGEQARFVKVGRGLFTVK